MLNLFFLREEFVDKIVKYARQTHNPVVCNLSDDGVSIFLDNLVCPLSDNILYICVWIKEQRKIKFIVRFDYNVE